MPAPVVPHRARAPVSRRPGADAGVRRPLPARRGGGVSTSRIRECRRPPPRIGRRSTGRARPRRPEIAHESRPPAWRPEARSFTSCNIRSLCACVVWSLIQLRGAIARTHKTSSTGEPAMTRARHGAIAATAATGLNDLGTDTNGGADINGSFRWARALRSRQAGIFLGPPLGTFLVVSPAAVPKKCWSGPVGRGAVTRG